MQENTCIKLDVNGRIKSVIYIIGNGERGVEL
jgi:hypothetical protein